jgi:hypothetical protein
VGNATALGLANYYRFAAEGEAGREPHPISRDCDLREYEEAAMFTNIMTGPTVVDVAGVSALGQALVYHEDEEARRSDKWNRELAQRLEAELVTLDSLAHGFAAAESLRRPADRSPARVRLARVAVAVLAIGLALAAVTLLGLRGARAEAPDPCLHAKAMRQL